MVTRLPIPRALDQIYKRKLCIAHWLSFGQHLGAASTLADTLSSAISVGLDSAPLGMQ
jgi:hypothetical protein